MITAIDLGYSTVKILQLTGGTSGYTILNSGSKAVSDNMKSYDPEKITKANLKKWLIGEAHEELGVEQGYSHPILGKAVVGGREFNAKRRIIRCFIRNKNRV